MVLTGPFCPLWPAPWKRSLVGRFSFDGHNITAMAFEIQNLNSGKGFAPD
jgi:hypothetical protein